MKNHAKKTLAVLICISLILSTGLLGAGATAKANAEASHDYTIISPYKDVNWDTWKALKAALHTHTIASDGSPNIDESVEMHYSLGFDILAVTDHMINAVPWNQAPKTVPIMNYIKKDRNQGKALSPLTDARYQEILNGVGRNGRGMLDVPLGVELNGAVPQDTHLNGLFADYGQGLIGVFADYATPAREVEKLGGVTFLNHLGNYTNAWDERNPDIARQPKFVNKFARIFLDYPSCVAMDINSGTDAHTGYDRVLWDEILQKTIPNGRNVSGISSSDSHGLDQDDRAFTIMMEPENTVAALKTCLETGAYFAVSRHAMAELGEAFEGTGPTPVVTRIAVDQTADKITLTGTHYDNITWVSNGKIIATGASIDLNDYDAVLGCYVRAYLTGPGGICYTQAFVVTAPDIDWGTPYVPAMTLDSSYFLRVLQTVLDKVVLQHSFVFKLVRRLLLGV